MLPALSPDSMKEKTAFSLLTLHRRRAIARKQTAGEPFDRESRYIRYDEKAFKSQSTLGCMALKHSLCPPDLALRSLLAMPGRASLPARLHHAAHGRKCAVKRSCRFPCLLSPSEKPRQRRAALRPLLRRGACACTVQRALYLADLCAAGRSEARRKRLSAHHLRFRLRYHRHSSAGLLTGSHSRRDRFPHFRLTAWSSRSYRSSPRFSPRSSGSPLKLPASRR